MALIVSFFQELFDVSSFDFYLKGPFCFLLTIHSKKTISSLLNNILASSNCSEKVEPDKLRTYCDIVITAIIHRLERTLERENCWQTNLSSCR